MKLSIKDFFSKCEQIRRKLRFWSHLLKKFLKENFTFCVVIQSKICRFFIMSFIHSLLEWWTVFIWNVEPVVTYIRQINIKVVFTVNASCEIFCLNLLFRGICLTHFVSLFLFSWMLSSIWQQISIPLENGSKPLVFLCFQGV